VAGETPGILATEDGGEGWTDLGSASLGRVRTFAFEATGQSGWAFTTRGTFSTGDGGKGWPSPKPALGPSDLATHWHFNEGFWADTSAVRLRVTPAAPGTAAPIPVAGGELFTTTAGKVFNLPTASGADTAAGAEQALGQAWQMGASRGASTPSCSCPRGTAPSPGRPATADPAGLPNQYAYSVDPLAMVFNVTGGTQYWVSIQANLSTDETWNLRSGIGDGLIYHEDAGRLFQAAGNNAIAFSLTSTAIPESSTVVLMGLGLVGLGYAGRRKRMS
jgi:hypothetical protein